MHSDGESKRYLEFSRTRGFCLESTHFTDAQRLSKLIALMSRGLQSRQSCAAPQQSLLRKPERESVRRRRSAHTCCALCWAIKTGEWLHQHQPMQHAKRASVARRNFSLWLRVKKHGRKAKSVFRYGLDYLRSIVTDLDLKYAEFLDSLQFLSCT